jgi:hypothetical protein
VGRVRACASATGGHVLARAPASGSSAACPRQLEGPGDIFID